MAKARDATAANSADPSRTAPTTTVDERQPLSLVDRSTRGDREAALDLLVERQAREARAFDARMQKSHRIVPAGHPTHQYLESSLREAAQILGINPQGVSLHIFARYPVKSLRSVRDPS
jgi:hypothetical protein